MLEGLRREYAEAVSSTLYVAAAAIYMSIPIAACKQWLKPKKVSAQRMKDLEEMEEEKRLMAVREHAESEEKATLPFANLSVPKATLLQMCMPKPTAPVPKIGAEWVCLPSVQLAERVANSMRLNLGNEGFLKDNSWTADRRRDTHRTRPAPRPQT